MDHRRSGHRYHREGGGDLILRESDQDYLAAGTDDGRFQPLKKFTEQAASDQIKIDRAENCPKGANTRPVAGIAACGQDHP